MSRIQEVLSANKNRRYPFVDDSDTGIVPDWMLLDLRVMDAGDRGTDVRLVGARVETGVDMGSPRTVTLLFRYGTVDFSIPVQIGSGVVIGKVTPASDLSIRYAVYGGESEYSFGVADGSYVVSARIMPSNAISLSKNMRLNGIAGVGGTATGTIHVKDGYNTTARVYGNTVRVEVGNGIGLGTYCRDEPERVSGYYHNGGFYEDDAYTAEIEGEDGVMYDDIPTGRSYRWSGTAFEPAYDEFDCSRAFMFVNGQHADTSGNINIAGGSGVSVQSGRTVAVDGRYLPSITVTVSKGVDELLGPVYLWKRPEDEGYVPTGFPVGIQVVRSYDGLVKYRGVLSEDDGDYSFSPSSGFKGASVELATGAAGTAIRVAWGVDSGVDEYSANMAIPGTAVEVTVHYSGLQSNPVSEIVSVRGLEGAEIRDSVNIYVPNSVGLYELWGSLGAMYSAEWVEENEDSIIESGLTVPAAVNFDRCGYCHNFVLGSEGDDITDWASFEQVPDDVLDISVGESDDGLSFEVVGLEIDGDDAMLRYSVEWADPEEWGDTASEPGI